MVDIGKRYDRMLDEMEFLYQQRRDARSLVAEWIDDGYLAPGFAEQLLTLLADRLKAGDKEGASV